MPYACIHTMRPVPRRKDEAFGSPALLVSTPEGVALAASADRIVNEKDATPMRIRKG